MHHKYLVARCRSFKAIAIAALLSLQAQAIAADDDAWLRKSREIIEQAEASEIPAFLRRIPDDPALSGAQGLLEQAQQITRNAVTDPAGADGADVEILHPARVLIFATLSLPEITLKSLLEQARDPNVLLLLRGVPEGADVVSTIRKLNAVASEFETPPNVMIDPPAFRRYKITVAPTLVYRVPESEQRIRVSGAVTVKWLMDKVAFVEGTESRDLGQRGEIFDITERDLIEEMQARMAKVNWAEKKQQSMENFWKKRKLVHLPVAKENKQVEFDPSVRVTEDVIDPDGEVLVAAGTILNPLDIVPMTKTVVVFDGTDEKQRSIAKTISSDVRKRGRGVILVTTSIDQSKGGRTLTELEDTLGAPVYMLQEELVTRFQLKHVPSTIAGRGNRLIITEYAVNGVSNE